MTTTHLLISLGTTICVGIFLYFYLKKRTEKIEKKVNLMFQLIQEHEKQARQQAQIMISQKFDPKHEQVNAHTNTPHVAENDLISVSDEDYPDSDDSEEVSDNENARIKISNIKTPFALNGAEITTNASTFDLDKTKNGHTITEIIGISAKDEPKAVKSDSDGENDDISNAEGADDNEEKVKIIELGDGDDLDEITLEDITANEAAEKELDIVDHKEEGDTDAINYMEIKQEVDNLVQNITLQKKKGVPNKVKSVNVSEAPDLRKLRVIELKEKCGELGLEGYKSLRKNALIELIASNWK